MVDYVGMPLSLRENQTRTNLRAAILCHLSPCISGERIEKDLAPYRIGKHSNPQNRAKNTSKIRFSVFLVYFRPSLLVGVFSFL